MEKQDDIKNGYEFRGLLVQWKKKGLIGCRSRWKRNVTMQAGFRLFVLGLLLHFLLHTFVTFKLGRDAAAWQVVRLWKELLIVGLVVGGLWSLMVGSSRGQTIKRVIQSDRVFQLLGGLMIAVMVISFVGAVGVTDVGLHARVVAAKYNIFPMVILLVWYVIGYHQGREWVMKQLRWTARVVSYTLVWSLIFYVVVGLKPGILKLFGYNPIAFEGVIGQAPPAVYLSLFDHGNMRNQFLFERPITWGFYLVMMFPLFFVAYIRRRSLSRVRGWWLLYVIAIAVTFSRAAWGVWLILIVLMLALTYRHRKPVLIAAGLGIVAVVGLMNVYDGRLLVRDFSDKGHLYALQDSLDMIGDAPFWGKGAGAAGPASHQLYEVGFNPENQFLQIVIEYGLIGFLPWMVFFSLLLAQGVVAYLRTPHYESQLKKNPQRFYPRYVVAVVLGLFGLGVEGLVLHSFADRMVMYPLMAMLGLAIGAMYSEKD